MIGRLIVAAALLLTAAAPAAAEPAPAPPAPPGWAFLGRTDVAHGFVAAGTVVGGLSAISYDPGRDLYYVLSDDRSERGPARFYTVSLPLGAGGVGPAEFVAATALLDRDGAPFGPLDRDARPPVVPPDPEGLAFDAARNQLYWSSEGERLTDGAAPVLLDPWVRVTDLDGAFRGEFALPPSLRITGPDAGPRRNRALEGLTLTPAGDTVFAAMEAPGLADGPLPTPDTGALTRITAFALTPDGAGAAPTAQYAYPLDAITAPEGDNTGLTDLVAVDERTVLTVERSYGTRTVVRLYRSSIDGADDVAARPSLSGARPMSKTLVADLSRQPGLADLDNVEAITIGPTLPDGRTTVVLVTDDNFNPAQRTQFLVYAL